MKIGDKIKNSIHGEFEVTEIYDDDTISVAGDAWTWSGHVDDLMENGFIVDEEKAENKKLKPCPFCGSDGFIEDETDHHGRWFSIGCSNKNCPCNWFIHAEPIDDDNDDELNDAIKKWNMRVKK